MKCPKCQHENPVDARFCNGCGHQLELACPEGARSNLFPSVMARFAAPMSAFGSSFPGYLPPKIAKRASIRNGRTWGLDRIPQGQLQNLRSQASKWIKARIRFPRLTAFWQHPVTRRKKGIFYFYAKFLRKTVF